MGDNVHWLRDTYGPALRAYYADLLKQPVPQKIIDLIAGLEADSDPAAPEPGCPAAAPPPKPQPDPSE